MPTRSGADLKKRADDLKRSLRKEPAKSRVLLERGTKHTRVMHKDTRKYITNIPDTPSDWRSIKNCVATLKREGIFYRHGVEGVPGAFEMPSMQLVGDGLRCLQFLGWEPGQRGRGGGAMREFGRHMQAAARKLDMEVHPNPDHYAKLASSTIVYGKGISHENLDVLEEAIDTVLKMVPKDKNGKLAEKIEQEVKEFLVEKEVEKAQTKPATPKPVPADVSSLPKVEYEEERKTPSLADALFMEVLVELLSSDTTKERAIYLAQCVAELEGF